jgi:hypothetical protein
MDINDGFSIVDPRVDIPRGISETELTALIGTRLRKITAGYFTLTCTSLREIMLVRIGNASTAGIEAFIRSGLVKIRAFEISPEESLLVLS